MLISSILVFVVVASIWAALIFNAYRAWQLGSRPFLVGLGIVTLAAGWSFFKSQNEIPGTSFKIFMVANNYSALFTLAVLVGAAAGIICSCFFGYKKEDALAIRILSKNYEDIFADFTGKINDYLIFQINKVRTAACPLTPIVYQEVSVLVNEDLRLLFDPQFNQLHENYIKALQAVNNRSLRLTYLSRLREISSQYRKNKNELLRELKRYEPK